MKTRILRSIRVAAVVMLTGSPAIAAERSSITSLDEMPSHSYSLSGTVVELAQDPEALASLRSSLIEDIESDLAVDDITDPATLQMLHKSLLRLDLLGRDYHSASKQLDLFIELEEKDPSRLVSALIPRAIIEAGIGGESENPELTFDEAFRASFDRSVASLSWPDVGDQLKEIKANAEIVSRDLILGLIETRIQPAVEATGVLSSDLAEKLIHLIFLAEVELPLNPIIVEVLTVHQARNQTPMTDIWASRELSLAPEDMIEPVVIGIWDAGVDADVFHGSMWTNVAEEANGLDDDGNGHVDDLHGIAFDLEGEVSEGLLLPLGDQIDQVMAVIGLMEGFWDLVSAVESPAASAARKEISTLPAAEVGDFINSLGLASHYIHGTHVAGIAINGAPRAKILVVRSTFDHSEPPRPLSLTVAYRLAESFAESTTYLAAHGARVVNMSWGFDYRMIESGLETGGVGSSADERAELAGEILRVLRDGLRDAMASTPEILYVNAAGNEDGDVDFDLVVPSSLVLPNLIVVGALDGAGNPTSFTSFGSNVRVYANGFQVESAVPGGNRLRGSGTSMAAPSVANLATKLISRDPKLTPERTIELIERGADPHPEHPGILRIDPRATWEISAETVPRGRLANPSAPEEAQ